MCESRESCVDNMLRQIGCSRYRDARIIRGECGRFHLHKNPEFQMERFVIIKKPAPIHRARLFVCYLEIETIATLSNLT